jgi:hypothetical protein
MMWNTQTDAEDSFRTKAIWGSAVVVVLCAVAAGVYYKYYYSARRGDEKVDARPAASAPPAEPAIRNPLPAEAQSADTKSLPALNDSDQFVHDSFAGLLGSKPVQDFLVPGSLVRHIVVTVDNLPRKKVAVELRPVKPTPGQTVVASQGDITTLSAANYERYAPIVKLVESTDSKSLATVYFQLYPLFQQAYEDLGYPGQFFNDRLVEVIDDLLRTPDVRGPIELTQPKVFYEYADPKLEALSSGQKLLLRMGPVQEALLKGKLRELRSAVAAQPGGAKAPAHETAPDQETVPAPIPPGQPAPPETAQ